MPNLRIVPVNAVDTATLALSSALASMPVDNVKLVARDRVCRSGALSPADTLTLTGTYNGSLQAINCWGFFRHNGLGAKARLELFSGSAFTGSLYDSGALDIYDSIPAWGTFNWGEVPWAVAPNDVLAPEAPFFKFLSTTYYVGSWRVSITLPMPYVEIGRLWLGQYLEAPYNPDYGLQLGWESSTERKRTKGGSRRVNAGERWKYLAIDLTQAADADRAIWLDILARCDLTDLVVCVFPGGSGRQYRDYLINGGLANLGSNVIENINWFKQPLKIEEN